MPSSPAPPGAPGAWQRAIQDCPNLVHLAPLAVRPESRLGEIVTALSSDLAAGVVFVTDADDRLVGWIPERTLDTGLMMTTLPGEMWRSVGEFDMRELLRAAHGKDQTAIELMSAPRTVTGGTALKDAVLTMVGGKHRVIALVDDQQRLLGYLTLFEVLAELSKVNV
jgi:CBS domain-containing protein